MTDVRHRRPAGLVTAAIVLATMACGEAQRAASDSAAPAGASAGGASAVARSDSSAGAKTASRDSTPPSRAGTAAAARGVPSGTTGGRRADSASGRGGASCAGVYLNVTVRAGALGAGTDAAARERALRDVAARVLAPVRAQVGTPELSPAIRAFRVLVRDTTATASILARLRASPDVDDVARDACSVRIS